MATELRIVGQGIAGTLLAWSCERAGVSFTIEDASVDNPANQSVGEKPAFGCSSLVGAGIINPITGQRLVKSWRIDELLPIAVSMYREIGDALAENFLFYYRLRRLFANQRERTIAREKWDRGDFAGFAESIDDDGVWFAPAYRVDLSKLVTKLRARWQYSGQWRGAGTNDVSDAALTVRCLGPSELSKTLFRWVGLRAAKGELIEIETEAGSLDPAVILNCHEWVVPLSGTRALVGATFEPGVASGEPTTQALASLRSAAERLVGSKNFEVVAQRAGVRAVTSDKHPVIGRHPENPKIGLFNGLSSKGALLAPWLAQSWVAHVCRGEQLDASVDVARFWQSSCNRED